MRITATGSAGTIAPIYLKATMRGLHRRMSIINIMITADTTTITIAAGGAGAAGIRTSMEVTPGVAAVGIITIIATTARIMIAAAGTTELACNDVSRRRLFDFFSPDTDGRPRLF